MLIYTQNIPEYLIQKGNSNTSFHAGADILGLLFLYDFSIFFHA